MSKRAEERGLEALPPRWRKTKDGKGRVDSALPVRKSYIRAYEQAERDLEETMERDALKCYEQGYKQAEKDIISLIETRISEIIGDAQPAPILRAELRELIEKIRKN